MEAIIGWTNSVPGTMKTGLELPWKTLSTKAGTLARVLAKVLIIACSLKPKLTRPNLNEIMFTPQIVISSIVHSTKNLKIKLTFLIIHL